MTGFSLSPVTHSRLTLNWFDPISSLVLSQAQLVVLCVPVQFPHLCLR